jgi:hypothetical protein
MFYPHTDQGTLESIVDLESPGQSFQRDLMNINAE